MNESGKNPDRLQTLELAEIFRARSDYLLRNAARLSGVQKKVFRAICACRTAALGGHLERCDRCANERIAYNSCRDRHCPKCQFLKKERWLLNRDRSVLPIPYFHVVFTVPGELTPIIWWNQRLLFDLLFHAVSRTLLTAARNPRLLGAEIGFICILHTWGQKLMAHPHIHCIVTGGGLRNGRWIPARENYFLPVKVLSRLFRGKFLAGLRKQLNAGRLAIPDGLFDRSDIPRLIADAYRKEWVVYCKEPFRKPNALLGYLGRYTHRVAITNSRLLDFDGLTVTFQYRDYARNKRPAILRLSCDEFIRRFLLHVLPARFMKIRHYGLLANCKIQTAIQACRVALCAPAKHDSRESLDWRALLKTLTGIDLDLCSVCFTGKMILVQTLEPKARPP